MCSLRLHSFMRDLAGVLVLLDALLLSERRQHDTTQDTTRHEMKTTKIDDKNENREKRHSHHITAIIR
jgi:hypothetical protein